MDILRKLYIPGYLSLIALLFAWLSVFFILSGEPNLSIIVMLAAFIFDLLDGFYARRLKLVTPLGRQVDSYVDVFTYLVFSALFFKSFLSPSEIVSVVIGFMILSFGGLRLIRFNNEGILTEGDKKFYRGLTVVHISLITLTSYFLQEFTSLWNQWFSTIFLGGACPLMLSNYRSFKIEKYWKFGVIIIVIAALSLFLEYGY